jgi:hypothetical protein
MAVTRVTDLAEYLADRRRVYDEAFAADLRRLRAVHGASSVIDALRLLEQQRAASGSDQWDRDGHRQAVQQGVERTIALRRLAGLSSLSE